MNVFPLVFCALKLQYNQRQGCRLLINMLKSVKKKKKKQQKQNKKPEIDLRNGGQKWELVHRWNLETHNLPENNYLILL